MTKLRIICPSCGAPIVTKGVKGIETCEYCGTFVDVASAVEDKAGRASAVDPTVRSGSYSDDVYDDRDLNRERRDYEDDVWANEENIKLYRAWEKKKNILVIVGVVVAALGVLFRETNMASTGIFILFVGYIALQLTKPKMFKGSSVPASVYRCYDEDPASSKVKRNKDGSPKPPWYLSVPAIVVIGLFSSGIYWIVGAVLRIRWQNNQWR